MLTKTSKGIEIYSEEKSDIELFNMFNGTAPIIDFFCVQESDFTEFTKRALDSVSFTDTVIVVCMHEALSSVFWNMAFDIFRSRGVKKILWVDAGLTRGSICQYLLKDIDIQHCTSNFFFGQLISDNTLEFADRSVLFLSLARMPYKERIYFTNKLINENMHHKGVVSCGWATDSGEDFWADSYNIDCATKLIGNNVSQFPISLGHATDKQQVLGLEKEFESAVINVVQESSIGFNSISHDEAYSDYDTAWALVNSDRQFFTEKSAKAFLYGQLPLFISAPGYVQVLRNIGFDVYDDLIDHSYDKEDNLLRRCDLVFEELKRLVYSKNISEWNNTVREIFPRMESNIKLIEKLGDPRRVAEWINSRLQ